MLVKSLFLCSGWFIHICVEAILTDRLIYSFWTRISPYVYCSMLRLSYFSPNSRLFKCSLNSRHFHTQTQTYFEEKTYEKLIKQLERATKLKHNHSIFLCQYEQAGVILEDIFEWSAYKNYLMHTLVSVFTTIN